MALFYNPTAIRAGALMQRRPMSEAQKQEALSQALQEQMANDPRSGQIQDWRDRSMTPFGVGAGLTGVAAQLASALVAKDQEKKLGAEYQDRQAKKNEMYSQILGQPSGATPGIGGAQSGGSPMDALTPQQRAMIGPMLADPDMQEQAAAFLLKQSFEPGQKPKYSTPINVNGELVTFNENNPDDRKTLGKAPNERKTSKVEMVGSQGPGQYLVDDATGDEVRYMGGIAVRPPSTVVNNIDNGEKSFEKEFGKNQGINFNDIVLRAQSAPQTISRINEFRGLIRDGTPTGKVQDMTMPARQFFNSIGITDDQTIAGQEALQSIASNFVLDQFSKLKGPQTDKDAVLVAGSVAQLSKTPEGNELILDLAERAANYDIELANEASAYVAANKSLDPNWIRYQSEWAKKNPLLTPELRSRIQAVKSGKPAAGQAPGRPAARPAIRNITVE
jgi:hypothetical protein